jgi:subtilisin family serine protease
MTRQYVTSVNMAECGVPPTEGKNGVPLRFPRPVIATGAIGLALAWTALGSMPALADQVRNQEWWLAKLHVTQAWQSTRGSGVTVALLDTGVDPAQPDLSGSVLTGKDFTNSGEQQGGPFFGVHGTAMASLIVGHGHGPGNTAGIVGVAPEARLLSVRVTLDGGDLLLLNSGITSGLPGAIAAGIRYAVSNGAQVIDLPLDPSQTPSDLVAPAPTTPAKSSASSPTPDGTAAERSAVAYALSQGVVLVAPAGDNGAGNDAPNFPADYPGVISAGAFDSGFVKAPYSSRQPQVTLTAAGAGMTAAVPPDRYAPVSSTAAASAVVTGIVALIKSKFPGLTPAQVTRALIRGTVSRPAGGTSHGSGHGSVDAARALAAAAAIAGPGLHRAGAGAVSRTPPAPPASPLGGESLGSKLERDALISLAVLGALLLPTLVYALTQRRRTRARAMVRAEQEQSARASSDRNGDGTADMMREYFATLSGPPGDSRSGGVRGWRGRAARAGEAVTFGDAGTRSAGTFADPVFAPAPADDAVPRAGGQIPRSPLAPVTRATPPRPPKVSGAPPWEPAQKPEGELPWTNASASGALTRRGAHAVPPTSSLWAAATPTAPAPSPQDAPSPPETFADRGGEDAGLHEADDDAAADGRPIYVWNPGASTETFPQVPREPGS